MSRWFIWMIGAIVVAGCGSHEPNPALKPAALAPVKNGPPADPDAALYEEIRSGTYQINSAIDAIADARKTAKDMASREVGPTQNALQQIATSLDAAGKKLAAFSDDPPSLAEFKANFAAQDERRLNSIEAATQALDNIGDAQDLIDKLLKSNPPEPEKTELSDADSGLDNCESTVEDAIRTMGGKVEGDAAAPPASKPTP